ncbi:MAG: formate/nitrite transporter family protein [Hyphomicrobiales bacterium]|nr:formate/nitrite transporter family protein [Hyphomicrobiales bacterium]MBV9429736.1 formate/nitrite transporter family protein [Bradyrhizobiaceae bacterium]
MNKSPHRQEKPDAGRRVAVGTPITEREAEDVEERATPRTPVIYEVVRRMGEEEMARPAVSLWWSGVAAGLSISFSLLAQAILQMHLPDTPGRLLVSSFGYSVGFVMVVLARQQLFTENTITVVLPVMSDLTAKNVLQLCRMWAIVLLANVAGTLAAAVFCTYTPVLTPELRDAMLAVSGHLLDHSWFAMAFRGVAAGFLIAAMVWLLPSSEGVQFHVITLMTYLIAAGGFMHIVAGSVEAFLLVLNGGMSWHAMLTDFFIPVLIGNVVGGTALFALISYAQVMQEI